MAVTTRVKAFFVYWWAVYKGRVHRKARLQRGTSRLAPTCQSVYYNDPTYIDWVSQICPHRLGFYGMKRDVVEWAETNLTDLWACHADAFKHDDAPDLPMGYEMLFANENDAFMCRMLHGGIVGGRPPKSVESVA